MNSAYKTFDQETVANELRRLAIVRDETLENWGFAFDYQVTDPKQLLELKQISQQISRIAEIAQLMNNLHTSFIDAVDASPY